MLPQDLAALLPVLAIELSQAELNADTELDPLESKDGL